ncbi:hypothetical protein Sjap_026262 [Stephania japonica]|uniref:Uncharacterized protein n=1 Tax=Stephania japonica TaxID=461633 RepID=A0AAP0E3B5_9MAGN
MKVDVLVVAVSLDAKYIASLLSVRLHNQGLYTRAFLFFFFSSLFLYGMRFMAWYLSELLPNTNRRGEMANKNSKEND